MSNRHQSVAAKIIAFPMSRIPVCLLFLLFFQPAFAQQEAAAAPYWYDRFLVDLSFDVANPVGAFADRQERNGTGGHFTFYYNLGNRPIYLGLGYHHLQYSNERQTFDELIDGELIPFSIRTGNFAQALQLHLRVQPQVDFPVQPFAEGLFRGQRFFTRTVIRDEDLDETTDSANNAGDASFGYGAAAGVFIPIRSSDDQMAVEVKASFIRGNSTRYLVRREVVINPVDPIDYFEPVTSTTDRWVFSVGIVGRIF